MACANCGTRLAGEYCSQCGQRNRDLHRPARALVAEAAEELFSLDSRAARTLGPLLTRPGLVTRAYLDGRRATYLPPLRAYLIAALVFFGLFTLFPGDATVQVFTEGSAEQAAARQSARGSQMTFSFPERAPFAGERYRAATKRARDDPERFAAAVFRNMPRAFFLFVPIFALMLELFYRKEGFFIEHLVFALYYHAVAFVILAMGFLVSRSPDWVPAAVQIVLGLALLAWLLAYLPIALRRVYGGTRVKTAAKVVSLLALYLAFFVFASFALVPLVTLFTF